LSCKIEESSIELLLAAFTDLPSPGTDETTPSIKLIVDGKVIKVGAYPNRKYSGRKYNGRKYSDSEALKWKL
jgi:hypothetical protein